MAVESDEISSFDTEHAVILSRMRAQFLSNLAHDLAGPLFAARGYIRLVLSEKDSLLSERQRKHLFAVLDNLARMTSATGDLNEISVQDSFLFEDVDLHALLSDAFARVEGESGNGELRMAWTSSEAPLCTVGDRRRLSDAVCNFLQEAAKFTGGRGGLEISARKDGEKITVEFLATRESPLTGEFLPAVAESSKVWRLHGGSVYVTRLSEAAYVIGFQLPVLLRPVRSDGCSKETRHEHEHERASRDLGD